MRVGSLLQESQKIRSHGSAKWCVIADAYHVKACKVLSISDRLQGEDSEVPASLSADA
jgi:hypothetical protein